MSAPPQPAVERPDVGSSGSAGLLDAACVAPLRSILDGARSGLQLDRVDVAFLVATWREMERPDTVTLPGPTLETLYGQLSSAAGSPISPAVERSRVDALIAQRLLLPFRATGDGRDSSFTLSPMGREIARAFDVGVDALERERLTSVMDELKIRLRLLRDRAREPEVDWEGEISSPLRGAVAALADDLARRKMRLDRLHEVTMASVQERLVGSSERALAECREVLRNATSVASELCEALLVDGDEALDLVDGLADAVEPRDRALTDTLDRLRNELERLRHWAESRLHRWTAYHRRVSSFIGMFVRLDPDRVVAGRLRSLVPFLGHRIADTGCAPYTLEVSAEHPYAAPRTLASPEMTGEIVIEPNVVTVDHRDERLSEVKQEIRRRASEALSADGKVALHHLLGDLGELPACDHNEICEWAVRHLASLGRPFRSEPITEWPGISEVLVAVQPMVVIGAEAGD